MTAHVCDQEDVDNRGLERKLEAIGWGLFFVWVGVAIIADVGWGAGLIGVGLITLLGQAVRKYFGVKTGTFWILLGSFFVLGGLWVLLAIHLSFVPVLCVIAGLVLVVSALASRPKP